MDTVKKIIMYIILVILAYVLVSLMTYGYMMKSYNNISEYQVFIENPSIEITESKSTKVNGFVSGKITNNTENTILGQYLRVNYYDAKDRYLGSTYTEMENIKPGEVLEFKTNHNYSGVAKYTMDVTDSKTPLNNNVKYGDGTIFGVDSKYAGIIMLISFIITLGPILTILGL